MRHLLRLVRMLSWLCTPAHAAAALHVFFSRCNCICNARTDVLCRCLSSVLIWVRAVKLCSSCVHAPKVNLAWFPLLTRAPRLHAPLSVSERVGVYVTPRIAVSPLVPSFLVPVPLLWFASRVRFLFMGEGIRPLDVSNRSVKFLSLVGAEVERSSTGA